MDIREILHLERIQSGSQPAASSDGKPFLELLREFEALRSVDAKAAVDASSTGLSGFEDALRRADNDFATLMEMRRKLEEAYRSRGP